MSRLAPLARRYRASLSLTYALTLLEQMCWLAYPALIGFAVDRLLVRRREGVLPLIGVWLLHLLVSFLRQRYDTRAFGRIHVQLAQDVVLEQRRRGQPVSVVSARAELSREIVAFFEHELPAIARDLIAACGALAMLFFYDWRCGLISALTLVPALWINLRFAPTAARINRSLNDQIEREVRVIERGSDWQVRRHFRLLARWRVALSDAEAWTWSGAELCMLVALVAVLFVFTGSGVASAGTIYAVIAYQIDLVESVNDMPMVVNNLSRLRDVGERLGETPVIRG
jgi:ABC-type multidrug transport system fused ATPase/permease subunit